MPGLSTGTLNLKFMQRALARSTPGTPTPVPAAAAPGPSTPASATGKSTPFTKPDRPAGTPSTPGPSAPAPAPVPTRSGETPTSKQLQEEEAAKWILRPAGEASDSRPAERAGVVFDPSYVGFLGLDRRAGGAGASGTEVKGRYTGGGGRMTFGGFGDTPADLQDDGRAGEGGHGPDEELERPRKRIGAVIVTDGDTTTNVLMPQSQVGRSALAQRKFLRPGGLPSPPSPSSSADEAGPSRPSPPRKSSKKRKDTDLNTLSPDFARKTAPPNSSAPTGDADRPAKKKKKKSKASLSASTAETKPFSPKPHDGPLRGTSVDERAKELKRQKKLKKRLGTEAG